MKSKISEYLEGLSRGGKVLETGQNFVVHLAKSREKMATFQTQDPAYCFLKWYQAAVAGGADEVFFEMDREHYIMIIPFAEEVPLGEICRAFEGRDAELCQRDRYFLEGLLASTSADFETSIATDSEVHVLSAGGLKKSGWWSRLAAYHKVYKKHSVRVSMRVNHSPGLRARIIRDIQERTRFGPILCYFVVDPSRQTLVVEREAPMFSDVTRLGWFEEYCKKPVLLEAWCGDGPLCRDRTMKLGKSSKSRYSDSLLYRAQNRAETVVLLGMPLQGRAALVPVQHGVTLQPSNADLGYPGVTVVFDADGLKTDLSGFKLSEGEAFQHKVQQLKDTVAGVVAENSQRFESLQAQEQYGLNPRGTIAGGVLGLLPAMKAVFIIPGASIAFMGFCGWCIERFLRRKEFKEAREARSRVFREEIRKRLFRDEPEGAADAEERVAGAEDEKGIADGDM